MLDKAMDDINNAEYDNFDNIAPNAEHISKQDSALQRKPSEFFGCFDPGNNKQHNLNYLVLKSETILNGMTT